MKERVGLPNKITLSRLALGPLFLIVYLTDWSGAKFSALIIVILSEATDIIDGWIARARGETSEIGKLIDPMADATVHLCCFVSFIAYGYAGAWMIAVLVYREIVVAYVRTLAALQGVVIGRRSSGRRKSFLQGTVIITILLLDLINFSWLRPHFSQVAYFLVLAVTLYTAFTLFDYIWGNRKILKELRWH